MNYRTINVSFEYSILDIDIWLRENYHTFLFTDKRRKEGDSFSMGGLFYGYDFTYGGPRSTYLSGKCLEGHMFNWDTRGIHDGEIRSVKEKYNDWSIGLSRRKGDEEEAKMLESLPEYHSLAEHEVLWKALKKQFGRKNDENMLVCKDFNGNIVELQRKHLELHPNGHGETIIANTYDFIQKLKQLYGEDEVDDFGRRRSML